MGSTLSEFGGRVGVTYFSDFLHAPSRAQLVAAVVQRRVRSSQQSRGKTPSWSPPDGWSGGADSDGTHEVLYHSELRLVRVSGREFELPSDGRTLILLVDEERTRPGERSDITVRSIDVPFIPHHLIDRSLDKATNLKRFQKSSREQHDAWRRALHSDPVTHAFLEGLE